MNNDIKEILKEVNKIVDNTSYNEEFSYFQVSHISKLLDYITNLQTIQEAYDNLLRENAELENKTYNLQKIEKEHQKLNGELREENKRLKELVNPKTQIFIDTQDMEERCSEELYKEYLEKQVKDYKTKIDKAIEILKKYGNGTFDEDLLNILQGSDKE